MVLNFSDTTRGGGNAREFSCRIGEGEVKILSESEIEHRYSYCEILAAIGWLVGKFGFEAFPLANNVAKLPKGEERNGLGKSLYLVKKDTKFAQGSSYLGVVLERIGAFEYVEGGPISWRIHPEIRDISDVIEKLNTPKILEIG
ncbi:hypothetical protein PVT68_16130 [Microbulbifer bruguierae]|uniref:Uncharacterized protein n=1 Tax=Microbulbifer bruguierae TaxID=3029061 RepID=A0ABY8NBJ2_9GAMM|nr:hypothetical protein [Microbulbifer bruguierae]WGL16283.1 hypothetical protein PVT68_16130 [Microbulbifer bruguierae]